MLKLKDLLVERIDYQDTAKMLVKHYGLRSKVKFGKVKGQNEADYDWVKDVINLKRSYPNVKEFVVSNPKQVMPRFVLSYRLDKCSTKKPRLH